MTRKKNPEKGMELDAVIEAPKGSPAKYKFDEKQGVFKLSKVLPTGAVFPYNFGFLPGTLAPDGDPIDVLVLTEIAAFPGCFIPCRIVGVLEARQSEKDGSTVRNDRLIAVATGDPRFQEVASLDDLDAALLKEISHFFVSYNQVQGISFEPLGFKPPETANALIVKAERKAG